MQQHSSNYFARRRPSDPGDWVKKVKIFQNMVMLHAYEIKRNHECSEMVANILPAHPPSSPLGLGQIVKIQLFQNMVVVHIKLKGITNAATW